jgi:serine/threonine protein kinase
MLYNFETIDRIFFVTKYFKAGELKTHLDLMYKDFTKGLSANATRHVILQLCIGLDFLHENRIVHCDVKPENVLMNENGYICLTDYGISKILTPEVNTLRGVVGTKTYMSPEIISNHDYNPFLADIWALGVTAYEALTGENPFDDMSDAEIIENIKTRDVGKRLQETYEDMVGLAVEND